MLKKGNKGWLLFFYSVPSRPVASRMKIWRRLTQAGALLFRGAVYILPYSDEHYEFYQWLTEEVNEMGGEAAFVHVERIEGVEDREIIELFNRQRERDYLKIEKGLEEIEKIIQGIKKGSSTSISKKLYDRINKIEKEFEAIVKTDFFSSRTSVNLKRSITKMREELERLEKTHGISRPLSLPHRDIRDYHGKTWVTRSRPFVDRMASAWLIKRFIDPEAVFKFIKEDKMSSHSREVIGFDISGGEFTHLGEMCTFEVLVKSFRFSDRRLKRIAAIVHEIDMGDEKVRTPESKGIELLLKAIRKTSRTDEEALSRGMEVFEMLYQAI